MNRICEICDRPRSTSDQSPMDSVVFMRDKCWAHVPMERSTWRSAAMLSCYKVGYARVEALAETTSNELRRLHVLPTLAAAEARATYLQAMARLARGGQQVEALGLTKLLDAVLVAHAAAYVDMVHEHDKALEEAYVRGALDAQRLCVGIAGVQNEHDDISTAKGYMSQRHKCDYLSEELASTVEQRIVKMLVTLRSQIVQRIEALDLTHLKPVLDITSKEKNEDHT